MNRLQCTCGLRQATRQWSARTALVQRRTLATTEPRKAPGSSAALVYASLLTAGLASGFALALVFPRPKIFDIMFPVPTPAPPDADSPEGLAHAAELERQLQALPIVQQLRNEMVEVDESTVETSLTATGTTRLKKKYKEARLYAATPVGPHSFTGYSLRGPGKFAIGPMTFSEMNRKTTINIVHIGSGMCGHQGIVHGGLVGTLLDESLGWMAFLNLPNNVGVTATLSITYKKPTLANQFVVIRCGVLEQSGRKVKVTAQMEDLDGQVLATADGLFVEPKMMKYLRTERVKELLKHAP